MQRRGAGTEANREFRADPCGERFFELADLRPRRQPVRPQHIDHSLDIAVIQALPPVRQQFFTNGSAAVNRERL